MTLAYLKDVVTLKLNPEKCIGCGVCTEVCPHAVFLLEGRKVKITDRNRCIECGACALNCPVGALDVDPGVGCAAAIVKGWITGEEPSCDCSDGSSCC